MAGNADDLAIGPTHHGDIAARTGTITRRRTGCQGATRWRPILPVEQEGFAAWLLAVLPRHRCTWPGSIRNILIGSYGLGRRCRHGGGCVGHSGSLEAVWGGGGGIATASFTAVSLLPPTVGRRRSEGHPSRRGPAATPMRRGLLLLLGRARRPAVPTAGTRTRIGHTADTAVVAATGSRLVSAAPAPIRRHIPVDNSVLHIAAAAALAPTVTMTGQTLPPLLLGVVPRNPLPPSDGATDGGVGAGRLDGQSSGFDRGSADRSIGTPVAEGGLIVLVEAFGGPIEQLLGGAAVAAAFCCGQSIAARTSFALLPAVGLGDRRVRSSCSRRHSRRLLQLLPSAVARPPADDGAVGAGPAKGLARGGHGYGCSIAVVWLTGIIILQSRWIESIRRVLKDKPIF